jgi:hypothetical protein
MVGNEDRKSSAGSSAPACANGNGKIAQRMADVLEKMKTATAASRQLQRRQALNVLEQVEGDRFQAAEILRIDLKSLFRVLSE